METDRSYRLDSVSGVRRRHTQADAAAPPPTPPTGDWRATCRRSTLGPTLPRHSQLFSECAPLAAFEPFAEVKQHRARTPAAPDGKENTQREQPQQRSEFTVSARSIRRQAEDSAVCYAGPPEAAHCLAKLLNSGNFIYCVPIVIVRSYLIKHA